VPFKSKRQQRFMFAAANRGDVPKGAPEKVQKKKAFVEMARELGRAVAQEKTAGFWDTIISKAISTAPIWAPAAAGSYLAGPGYRLEGAAAGAAAGGLGKALGRAAGVKSMEGVAKGLEGQGYGAYRRMAEQIGKGVIPAGAPEHAKQTLKHWGTGGSILAGGAGGLTAGRLLGAQNPYGLQPVFPGLERENPLGIRPQ